MRLNPMTIVNNFMISIYKIIDYYFFYEDEKEIDKYLNEIEMRIYETQIGDEEIIFIR